MGKFNFDYEKLRSLEAQNKELMASNAKLTAQVARLEESVNRLQKGNIGIKRTIAGALDREKYLYLFGWEIDKNGEIRPASSGAAASDLFTPFQAIIMRAICPRAYMPPQSKTGKYRFLGKRLEDLTDEEYLAVVETFQSVVDILASAKKKLTGGDKNVL